MCRHGNVAALMLTNHDLGGRERLFEHVHTPARLGIAAQEHVQRCATRVGMAVNRDVPTVEDRERRYPTTGSAQIDMHVKQVCTRHVHATPQRLLDMSGVVQPARAEQVYEEMTAGNAGVIPIRKALDFRESIGNRVHRPHNMCGITMIFLLGGA